MSVRCRRARRHQDNLQRMGLRVADNPNKARYEILAGGVVAGFIDYHLIPHGISFLHAEIEPESRGNGLGGRLVRDALDSARERGLEVVPLCPFVRSWIGEHPDYADLRWAGCPPDSAPTCGRDATAWRRRPILPW